jgi:glycosyltransferase involved in cell wall biosynthesis
MPKVSVILTSYNHDKYIHESINSVLNQTFTDFELIILDDASVDESWNIIQSYSDPRIRAFRNNINKGPVSGVNNAIVEIVSGDYIAIHHSDDVWALDKLEKQVDFLDANQDVGAVFTWVQIIDENGEEKENDHFNQENKTRWQWLLRLFVGDNRFNHPSVLIRKQCYQDVGFYRYDLVQTTDAEMWSRVLIKFPIHILQEKLTRHRLFSDHSNTSGSRTDVAIRISNEWNIIRENFLALTEFEDIVAIFPGLESYRNPAGCDYKFLLAMACLYECKQRNAWQLGLNWLFELLNDETRHKKITGLYAFSYVDLIKLTGEFDVSSIFQQRECVEQIEAQRQEIQSYEEQAHIFSEQLHAQLAVIANRDAMIRERDAMIIDRDAMIKERDAIIKDRETIIKDRDATIKDRDTIIIERDAIIHERDATIKDRDTTINELNTIFHERDATINEMLTSRSWRFTRPLRLIERLIRDPKLLWSQLQK